MTRIVVEPHPAYVQVKQYVTGPREVASKFRYRCRDCGYESMGYKTETLAEQAGKEAHRCIPTTSSSASPAS